MGARGLKRRVKGRGGARFDENKVGEWVEKTREGSARAGED